MAVLGVVLGTSARADMYRPGTNVPGGVPAQSTITSITVAGSNTTVCWYGMQGWYGVEMSTNGSAPWTQVGRTSSSDFPGCLTVPNDGNPSASFRLNQANSYVGSGGCGGCHGDKFSEWKGTAHSSAYSTIANLPLPAAVKETCYPCHTVGKDQPTGFVNITNTPHLTDVGCENCHGPAGWHKYSDHDLIHPAVSIDPAICGGCHTGDHHPTYDEYETTLHAEVNIDIKYGSASATNYYTGTIPWTVTNVTTIPGTSTTNIFLKDGILTTNVFATASRSVTSTVPSFLYGYYVTGSGATNGTTGIIHSGNGPGTGFVYDPGQDRAVGCGICHSAATRMAQVDDYEARLEGRTNALVFAAAKDGGAWTTTCANCHDPHSAENEAQLRNPLWSTNYYTMPTTADKRTTVTTNFQGGKTTNVVFYSAAFANMYDPNVQVCGQCHNSRGARWDGRSFGYYRTSNSQSVTTNGPGIVWGVQTNISYARPPHHSPQYNILSGIVQPDYLNGTNNIIHAHGLNTKGCAACHMHSEEFVDADPDIPAITGHHFEPELAACATAGCHGSITEANDAMDSLQAEVSGGLATLVSNLNNWAMLRGRAIFGANLDNYLQNGWEYTTPGGLATITNAGPSASDQLKIPVGIRQARFNAYMVSYGNSASLGVHNPDYTRYLLEDASNKVYAATYPLPSPAATFTASPSTNVAAGQKVSFVNTSAGGLTSFNWIIEDATGTTTSTKANPTYTYTNLGSYTVTLEASGVGGSVTNIRVNYITVVAPPVADFTCGPATNGPAPLTVNFTNTSTGALTYSWSFGDGRSSANVNPVYTYTNTAVSNYTITLRAIRLGVTNTLTRTDYIGVTP